MHNGIPLDVNTQPRSEHNISTGSLHGHGHFRLSRLLYTRSWISNERPSLLFDLATGWLIQHKILLPGVTTLTRLISEVRERSTNRLWQRLSVLPTQEQVGKLETLLQVPEGSRTSCFDRYRKGPVTISGPAFNEAVDRYRELKASACTTWISPASR